MFFVSSLLNGQIDATLTKLDDFLTFRINVVKQASKQILFLLDPLVEIT